MDLTRTRTALHGVAELLLAGPQYAESSTIRLRVVPGGIATVAEPDLRLEGGRARGRARPAPARGHLRRGRAAAGVDAPPARRRLPRPVPTSPSTDEVDPDPEPPRCSTRFAVGDAALRAFAPDEEPVFWPEHLDVGDLPRRGQLRRLAGRHHLSEPYAYVGPWTARTGEFWNHSFGAARPMSALGGADAVVGFFREGARLAAAG